jgi:uncharacterized protein
MIAVDVNVLIYAISTESRDHLSYKAWLESARSGSRPLILFDAVLASAFRILTHHRVFQSPLTFNQVEQWVDQLIESDNIVVMRPGERHWKIFMDLCRAARASGNLISDAYLAALAIEHGCEWITTDRDFSRFRGLRWRHPLE